MATKVLMEALSPTMEEGRLVEWKKAEGERVAPGDVLAEVETDKAVMELVARAPGVLLKQLVAAGETVPVASVIAWIGEPGESVEGESTPPGTPGEPALGRPTGPEPPPARRSDGAAPSGGRVRASPLARRLARERGLDLAAITGTGPEGRVVKRDVEAAAHTAPAAAPSLPPTVQPPDRPFTEVPLTQIRKTIAKRLAQSIGPVPTFYLTTSVDMEQAVAGREALRAALGDDGQVSINDIVLKAVATALTRHPECNAWWQEDHIRQWHEVHLGMAVAIPDGLITPVIRHADRKSLRDIARESRELAERARARTLRPEEYTGATFTVSNLGMFDIEHFTAIINPPEAGILAVGRVAATPVPGPGGQVEFRKRMRLTMSCDHRVIDGATGARFLQTLRLMLEQPLAMLW
jgi:pyruvate dehydrogenase E2 component (dihydrolipoamide acetyltransferase)